MFTLKLDEIPDEGLNLQWTEERASLLAYLKNFSQIDFDFETALLSEVKIWKTDQSVLMKGKVETNLRLQCVRCLKEFSYPLSSTFELTLHPLKGASFAENRLQIVTPGGTVGGITQEVEDQPIFHEGKQVRIYFQEIDGEFYIVCAQFGVEEL